MGTDSLLLKWGTVKGWHFETLECEAAQLLNKYMEDAPFSCMADMPNDARKELLCQVIDALDGEIQNDWTGEMMSKSEAKEYIRNYRA